MAPFWPMHGPGLCRRRNPETKEPLWSRSRGGSLGHCYLGHLGHRHYVVITLSGGCNTQCAQKANSPEIASLCCQLGPHFPVLVLSRVFCAWDLFQISVETPWLLFSPILDFFRLQLVEQGLRPAIGSLSCAITH